MLNEQNQRQKRDHQLAYKQMLDQQVEVKSAFRMYGNMSSIEKAMNKHDM